MLLVLVSCSFLMMVFNGVMADDRGTNAMCDTVAVQCLTENKKVIPLYWQCGQFWTTNVKLPDLVLINRSADPVTPCELGVVGTSGGREVAVNRIADDLRRLVKQVDAQFKEKLGSGMLQNVCDPRLATEFGAMVFGGTRLSGADTVNTGESAVILLSHVLFFTYTGLAKIDDLCVTLTVQQGSEKKTIQCPINFTPYQTKGDYVFPLKGALCVTNLPMDIAQHRKALSQEFAIDILAAGLIEKGQFSGAWTANPQTLTDYAIFHREVGAVGDGIIVEAGDKFPESLMSNPAAYSEKQFEELTAKLVPEIGTLNTFAGNYIIIDHENGEFSAYAHLSEGSIRVKPGDRVAKGDVIAAVGNTGHSTEPHLHFQLMDSKDFLTANGLPVMFSNVPPNTANQNCKAANSLLATDYIMLRIDK
jgi:hypothetical protein